MAEKIVTMCSPFQGHIVAVTDKGKVIIAKDLEDFEQQVKKLK